MLSAQQKADWSTNGYLVLPGFKSATEVAAACQRAQQLVAGYELPATLPVFSTSDRKRVADAALLASANTVQCFFEEEAVNEQGQLTVPKSRAINKIGHALHDLDPVFKAFSHGRLLSKLAAALGLEKPQLWQSMLIFKQPRIGGEVGWHQDASFLASTPESVVGFWFALEDAKTKNGCLRVQPGGHRGPLRERYVLADGKLQMQTLDSTPWPDATQAVAVPAKAGTLIVFHGLLPHYSAPNRSAHSRLAYTLHATDGRSTWSPLNWLQRGAGDPPLRGFV
jgi:phytanoyl-CoA hydroxylase